jgi:alkanesulfonate monooxygenase SsuD/methylene tetrahydromethanopterin reductase-like flavin-dependent oxidoreductase (luciferase family)
VTASEPVRIGVGFQVWGQATSWPALAATVRDIERLGYDSVWTNDHLFPAAGADSGAPDAPGGPFLEGWISVAGLAAETGRIPLGVLVSGAGYRNPGLLVKMATALDHISGGRAILGLGAGWHEREHRAFGFDYPAIGDRITRLDEQSAAIRALLDGEEVTVDGRFVRMDRARNLPPPIQARLPLMIGASGEKRSLAIVARDADIWNGEGDAGTYARKSRILDEHCARIGRDPASIRRTVGVAPLHLRDDRATARTSLTATLIASGMAPDGAADLAGASPFAGTVADALAALDAYAAAGAEEAIIDWPAPFDLESLERLADARRSR